MDFHIEEQYLTDVVIYDDYFSRKTEVSPEELFDILRGKNKYRITRHENHPVFEDLRQQLENEGYIQIERKWSNGDVVLKPFTLNGVHFTKGQKFCCAPALRFILKR